MLVVNLKYIKNRFIFSTLKFFLHAMQLFPRWFTQALFNILFFFSYFFLWNLKKICQKNLKLVYGASEIPGEYQHMTRACFYNMGAAMLDMLYFVKRPKALEQATHLHHEERLQGALAQQKGVVLVTAHLSNFPSLFLSLILKGYAVNVVIRPMRNKEFGQFMYDLCALWKIKMIETFPQRTFVKESFAALKRNELLVILLDEVVPADEGVNVPFLGTIVSRATGPFLFYERIGSPIVPIFIVQDEQKEFHIFVEPEFTAKEQPILAESMQENVARLTVIIESYVKKYPQQWGGWLNKRWLSHHEASI